VPLYKGVERKETVENVTTEACDTRKSGTMLSQYGNRVHGSYFVRVLTTVSLLFAFQKRQREDFFIDEIEETNYYLYQSRQRVEPLRLKSLKRCGPPNGTEGERNGAFDQPTLSGFSPFTVGKDFV
jgi:hypothetical protein